MGESLVLISAMALISLAYLYWMNQRSDIDVLRELQTEDPVHGERARGGGRRKRVPRSVVVALIGGAVGTVLSGSVLGLLIGGGIVGCIAVLISERRTRTAEEERTVRLEFQLPIFMERLVMAVQAGLDVLSAIKSVLENELASTGSISELGTLAERAVVLTENGVKFEDALHEVADSVPVHSVRHAFIHLALAHREGGELVMPLRELSDSTQLGFQETVEEKIAALPVKATFPLLLTFAGLLVMFMTPPLLSVMESLSKSTNSATLSARSR